MSVEITKEKSDPVLNTIGYSVNVLLTWSNHQPPLQL